MPKSAVSAIPTDFLEPLVLQCYATAEQKYLRENRSIWIVSEPPCDSETCLKLRSTIKITGKHLIKLDF